MTGLHIGTIAPDRHPLLKPQPGPCPSCGSKPDKRVTEGCFGTDCLRVLCGHCGYEFKEQA